MKPPSRLLPRLAFAVALACVPRLAVAPARAGTDPTNAAPAKPPCCRELKAGTAFTDRSLYQLESQWTSDIGRTIKLGVLAGRPQVVALFFTHCENACPILLNDLRRIEAALPEKVRDQVDFLLITIDPERDTPEVLHAYRQSRHLPLARWSLLHGRPDDVRELAALLGVNYRRDQRGQFAHSNLLTLLNAQGEIVRQLPGLNQDITAFVRTIEQTVARE